MVLLMTGCWPTGLGSAPPQITPTGADEQLRILSEDILETDEWIRAARSLSVAGDRRAVEPLIEALCFARQSWEPTIRVEAAMALGRLKAHAAVAPLSNSLEDRSAEVRAAAATALGRIGDPAAIPALQRALGDPYPVVACDVADALASLGSSAVEPLIEVLDAGPVEAKPWAARALKQLHDPRAREALAEYAAADRPAETTAMPTTSTSQPAGAEAPAEEGEETQ